MDSSKGSKLQQDLAMLNLRVKQWSFARTTYSIERKYLKLTKMWESNNLGIARRRASVAETETILARHDYPHGIFRVDLQQVQAALEGLKEELWYMTRISTSMEEDIAKAESEIRRRKIVASDIFIKVCEARKEGGQAPN